MSARFVRALREVHQGRSIVLIPYAGSSPHYFSPWLPLFPQDLSVYAVALPGRVAACAGARIDWTEYIHQVEDELQARLDEPFTVFGHSLGGLVAYGLCQRRLALGRQEPRLLRVSSFPAPDHVLPTGTGGMDDSAFARWLEVRGIVRQEVMRYPEILSVIVTAMRTDFALVDSFVRSADLQLGCGLQVLYGEDDPHLGTGNLQGWSSCTRGAFDLAAMPGGHFYLDTHRNALAQRLAGPA